jgi:hypothetical protein
MERLLLVGMKILLGIVNFLFKSICSTANKLLSAHANIGRPARPLSYNSANARRHGTHKRLPSVLLEQRDARSLQAYPWRKQDEVRHLDINCPPTPVLIRDYYVLSTIAAN